MADLLSFAPVRVLTEAAEPGAGYLVSFFSSGTTSGVTVYTSSALDTPHSQPIAADAEGVFPAVFAAGGAIKAVITDSAGATVYTVDPVIRVPASSSAASSVTFDATASVPASNVQDAIELAAASAATGFTPFGLGVTGTAALLANIDATNIASGAYRFDGTTTGTFPSGVTAAGSGIVVLHRETSGDATMTLFPSTANDSHRRLMSASVWGSWARTLIGADVLDEDDFATDSATKPPSQQSTRVGIDRLRPTNSAGFGQWTVILTGSGASYTLPAGGTWAYFRFGVNTSSGTVNGAAIAAGVAAGGTLIAGASGGVQHVGFAWRVT